MDPSLGLPEGEYTFEHERRAFELLAQVSNAESLAAEPQETQRLLVSGALAVTPVPSSVNVP